MSMPGIYALDLYRHREIVKKQTRIAKNHIGEKLCSESRWPYTTTLTPQQIACMRDCYCGRRVQPTALKTRSAYDRIHEPEEGWDPMSRLGSRHFLKPLQISAREEEKYRTRVLCANATYGHRAKHFYDFQNKENRRTCYTKHFLSRNGCSLPPLPHRK
ncbi:hypothetical protein EGW08_000474 [Elysia chlorotica]|uniref:Domain of unknown function with conserved HDNR motif domain-containing protein n=1 Tax=Elysia chlorotica TaxID=188477 RepID=A0A433UD77_ELYCH|nr:hypothetical protein EGW08_000474 [Elysia chlorotica]